MGFSLSFFIVPAQISAGGVSGIATVLYHLFNLPVGVMVFVLNIPIFILGFVTFDGKFLLTSILGTLALSVSAQFFEADFFQRFVPVSDDLLLCSVFGGGCYGLGLGLAVRSGGTTGGTDILSLVMKKWFPSFSVGQFVIAIDGVIIAASGLVYRRLDISLYSVVMLFVCSYVLDAILDGVDFAKIVYIISDSNPVIAAAIGREIRRGSTILSGYSVHTKKDRNMLMCVMKKHQVPKLKEIVTRIDGEAFVVVTDAKEVIGLGFKLSDKIK